jgi:hypothetical protein
MRSERNRPGADSRIGIARDRELSELTASWLIACHPPLSACLFVGVMMRPRAIRRGKFSNLTERSMNIQNRLMALRVYMLMSTRNSVSSEPVQLATPSKQPPARLVVSCQEYRYKD